MLPDAPRTEQGAITKLATELAAISGLTPRDLNLITVTPKQTYQAPPRSSSFRAPPVQRKRRRSGVLRVVLLGAALHSLTDAKHASVVPAQREAALAVRRGHGSSKAKNTHHANGRLRNQANGRQRNQGNGRLEPKKSRKGKNTAARVRPSKPLRVARREQGSEPRLRGEKARTRNERGRRGP